MRKLSVALWMFAMVLGSAASAQELVPEVSVLTPDSIQEFGLTEGVEEANEWAVSRCQAVHQCRNGRTIGCTAQGLVTRCARGGGKVICRAWGSGGTFSQAVDRCRR